MNSTQAETASRDAILNAIGPRSGGERIAIGSATGLQNQLKAVANSLLSQYVLQVPGLTTVDVKELKIDTDRGAKATPTSFVQ
jgi:hypothetical protein